MAITTVAVYTVTIHKKNQSTKDLETLSDFDNGKDLIELFQRLPALLNDGTTISTIFEDKANQKRLSIDSKEFKPFGRCIEGELESGDYGVESVFIDSSGKKKGTLGLDDSPMMPFYFLCDIPQNVTQGYILFQRFKQFGVFSMFAKAFRSEFAKKHPDYTISFNPLTSYNEFNRILNEAEIKRVSFVSREPRQFMNVFTARNLNDNFLTNDVFLEVSLVAKRDKKINLMNSVRNIVFNSNEKISKYFEVAGLQDTPIKIYFKANERTYTLDTTRIDHFSPDIDISSFVSLNSKGFPNVSDVKKASIKIISDIKAEQNK